MTDCIPVFVRSPRCKGREVEASFAGGANTSNGLLPRPTQQFGSASRPPDGRNGSSCWPPVSKQASGDMKGTLCS